MRGGAWARLSLGRRLAVGRLLAAVVGCFLAGPASAQTPGETIEYYGLDAIGSVRIVFDPAGTVLARLDYGPFGRVLSSSPAAPDRKFAGLFRDGEAGLDYAEARSYQVRTGRFNAPDPVYAGLFEPQAWNRYAYAFNNPFRYVDPNGAEQLAVNCGAGPQWCPGNIQIGPDKWVHSDGFFDAQSYGYHGGEPGRALEAWSKGADTDFYAPAIFGKAGQKEERSYTEVGKCEQWRCAQITNDYRDGRWKLEGGDNKWDDFKRGERAVNTDGALFNDTVYKVTDFTHITIKGNGHWEYDSPADAFFALVGGSRPGSDPIGTYHYDGWVIKNPSWTDPKRPR